MNTQKNNMKEYYIAVTNVAINQALKRHIEVKHEGVKYNCSKCSFKSRSRSHLNEHTKVEHEGVQYNCDKCSFTANCKTKLYIHIKSMHAILDRLDKFLLELEKKNYLESKHA